ncbi:transglutaminase family protein [Hoyosella subflava]|uniref:Putative transglutaminase-like enzyme n=1 Tax=Hoyosella subflava (strain DSM 45089 / JCM 17490 / NBRC 109087 / DQS3-9A1) TaxID=443218 RepID=F6EMC5_HOYSD|nr:transglutaminase family protein [Hoyosella subflava]AEF40285.1 putative transglutaminase-like enzyme [Hoyosella subflava DQS3-9A1]
MSDRLYEVTHITTYTYPEPVTSSYGRGYLTPLELPEQRRREHAVSVSPEPSDQSFMTDFYGNTAFYFHVTSDHDELVVTGRSLVEVDAPQEGHLTTGPAGAPWELSRPVGREAARAVDFRLDNDPPEVTDVVREYAAPIFVPGRSLAEAIWDLTHRIYTDFTYHSGSTTVSTRVAEVMHRRSGVCQDFARVAIACLRAQGLAASYVSGYLATTPPPGKERMVGADATHAWAAVWLPGGAWLAFDPTNDQFVDERYVTVARGRDFVDVSPLRGIIYTRAKTSSMSVSVDVAPVASVGTS